MENGVTPTLKDDMPAPVPSLNAHTGWCSGDRDILLPGVRGCSFDTAAGISFLLSAGCLTIIYLRFMGRCQRHRGTPLCIGQPARLFSWYRWILVALSACHIGMLMTQLYSQDYTTWTSLALHPSKIFLHTSAILAISLIFCLLLLGQYQKPRVPIPRAIIALYCLLAYYTLQALVVVKEVLDGRETVIAAFLSPLQCALTIALTISAKLRADPPHPDGSDRTLLDVESAPSGGPKTKPAGAWTSLVLKSLVYVWPSDTWLRVRAAVCLILVACIRCLNLAVPILYKHMVNLLSDVTSANKHPDENRSYSFAEIFVPAVLLYLLAWFLQGGGGVGGVGAITNARTYLWIPISQDAEKRISVQAFAHIMDLDLSFHLKRKTGELIRIMDRGTGSMKGLLNTVLFSIGPAIFDVLAASMYLSTQQPWMALIVLASICVYLPVTIYITEYRGGLRREMNSMDNKKSSRVTDALLNYETVKYFTSEVLEAENYGSAIGTYQLSEYRMLVSLVTLNFMQCIIMFTAIASGMMVCIAKVASGELTVGDAVLFLTLMSQLYGPLNYFGTYYRVIQQNMIDMENLFDLLGTVSKVEEHPNAKQLCIKAGSLEFRDVSFAYDPQRSILQNISFKINGGQTVAFVGSTGSGKSTLLRLLFRFYDPDSGTIFLDGEDISKLKQRSLRSNIAVVPQDTVLFNDTIEYNIRYGCQDATFEEVEAAAKGASLHDSIQDRFPQGYSTTVGERGLRLSGGEKQRVAFARAILKNPAVLILDEATSALDSITEKKIQAHLHSARKIRTTVVVAHRLSTIMDADLIVVLKDGCVIEQGKHSQLVQNRGLYHELWQKQRSSTAVDVEDVSDPLQV